MRDDSVLLTNLLAARSSGEVFLRIAEENYVTKPIGDKENNRGVINLAPTPYHAIIEGITNGNDAVVKHFRNNNWFPPEVKNYRQALQCVADAEPAPHVHLYVQNPTRVTGKTAGSKVKRIVTVIDTGCGMSEKGMIAGPLNILSGGKSSDPLQAGSFGMGSSTNFQHSEVSLIVSRQPDSELYYFALVYRKPETETASASYVYICRPNGSLFSARANRLNYVRPGASGDFEANCNFQAVLPEHGTIRKQWGMEVQYWGQHESSLYSFLPDYLFGCPTKVRLVGDDNAGRLNVAVGRRYRLDAVAIGDKLNPKSDMRMVLRKGPTKVRVFKDRNSPIGDIEIRAWVISPGKSSDGKSLSAVYSVLDGNDSENRSPPMGTLVTLNGQTHTKLRNTIIFRNADLINLTANTIIEVSLDGISARNLEDVIQPNRVALYKDAEKAITEALIRYLRAHPEFAEANQRLATQAERTEATKVPPLLNRFFDNKLLRTMLTDAVGGLPFGGVGVQSGKFGGANAERATLVKPAPTVTEPPKDVPPLVVMPCSLANSGFVQLRSSAPDGTEVELKLVSFLRATGGTTKVIVRDGRAVVPVHVEGTPKTGTRGIIEARIVTPDGESVTATGEVLIRALRPKGRPEDGQAGEGKMDQGPLDIREEMIDGRNDSRFESIFGNVAEGEPAYVATNTDDTITIYHNTKFGQRKVWEHWISEQKDAAVLKSDFERRFRSNIVVFAARQTINASTEETDLLVKNSADNAVAIGTNICMMYHSDEDLRRAIVSRARAHD